MLLPHPATRGRPTRLQPGLRGNLRRLMVKASIEETISNTTSEADLRPATTGGKSPQGSPPTAFLSYFGSKSSKHKEKGPNHIRSLRCLINLSEAEYFNGICV